MIQEQSKQNQLGLFTTGHQTAATSRQAYSGQQADQPRLSQRKTVILNHLLQAHDGLTREQLADVMQIRLASVCGLIGSLKDAKRVFEQGTRKTRSGSMAKIVRLVEAGK